jgi:hypothetical protein
MSVLALDLGDYQLSLNHFSALLIDRAGYRSAGTVDRVRAWLAARPTECWGFFAAGFVLAVILT